VAASPSSAAVTARAPEVPSLTPPGNSAARAISGDGRYVVFESNASALIAGQVDRNGGGADLFLFDAVAKSIVLVSRAAGWVTATGNGKAENPSISADGRYIAYTSLATDLVAGVADTNEGADVFLFDRVTGATTLVSRSAAGGAAANRISEFAVLSADGRYVAFDSQATDLIAGLDARSAFNVFLYDRESGSVHLVSRSAAAAHITGENISLGPVLSADGRYVAFVSYAKDLAAGQVDPDLPLDGRTLDLFLHDRATGATALVTHLPGSSAAAGGVLSVLSSISADGRFLAFSARGEGLVPNVPNGDSNVYLYDRTSGINTLLSSSEDGYARDSVISADGRYVAFLSDGSDLIPGQIPTEDRDQLFLFDRAAGSLSLVKGPGVVGTLVARGHALTPSISADGRYIAFVSTLLDFVQDEFAGPDVFLYDRVSGTLTLVSRTLTSAVTGGGGSFSPLISADGQRIAFSSRSPELANGDYNGVGLDTFLFSRTATPGGPVSVPPCTLLDTRRVGNRPALRSNVPKVLTVGGACGVPATAKSVLVKVTALQSSGKGNLRFFAGSAAASSGILRFQKNRTQAADFTLPLGQGKLNILPFVAGNGTVHVIVEVKGYVR
jgi:TolB protein